MSDLQSWDVHLRIEADTWVSIDAATQEQAEEYARDMWTYSDLQNARVVSVEARPEDVIPL